jgi:hypothetical protein
MESAFRFFKYKEAWTKDDLIAFPRYFLHLKKTNCMDPILDQNVGGAELGMSAQARNHLYEAARWGKFLAIVGFVGIGLLVLVGLVMGILFGAAGSEFGAGGLGMLGGGFMTLLYILIAIFYFFPVLYLYRFSMRGMSAARNGSQAELEDSLANLKSMFKFLGILTVVVLCLYGLGLVIGLIAAVGYSSM